MLRNPLRLLFVLVVGALVGVTAFELTRPHRPAGAAAEVSDAVPTSVATTSFDVSAPSSTTSAAPASTVPPPEVERGWLVIQGTGDVNLDPGYIPAFAEHGYGYAFAGLEGLFREDQLTVINLECSPSPEGTALDKEYTFRCDPDALPVAVAHGVEVANLANNHSQDYGREAMLDGRRRVAEAGIAPVGVGADLAEATRPALFDLSGWRVAVLGMGGVVPSPTWLATEDRPGMASGDAIDQMTAAVSAAAEVADVVVVSIHWGTERVTAPDPSDRARAEAMIAAGADVIFGHHAHRLGRMELIDGRPVFWTLGNFIWPRLSHAGSTTGIGRLVVSPEGEISACILPAFIHRSGQPLLTGGRHCGPHDPAAPVDAGEVS